MNTVVRFKIEFEKIQKIIHLKLVNAKNRLGLIKPKNKVLSRTSLIF